MKKFYLLAIAALAMCGSAYGQNKINARGQMILDNYRTGIIDASAQRLMSAPASRGAAPSADVLVRTTSDEVLDRLIAEGYRAERISRSFIIVEMPLDRIEDLAAEPEVKSLSFGEEAEAKMDIARQLSMADDAHEGTGITFHGEDGYPFKGDGVIVGMFDHGVDPAHVNWLNDDMTATRLKFYVPYITSSTFNVREYKGEATRTAPSDDENYTHGTHVAGIMGGSYNGEGHFYGKKKFGGMTDLGYVPLYGVAPHADLAIGCAPVLSQSYIQHGIKKIVKYAETEGKPLVINLSLGSNSGPHDGTDDHTAAINEQAEKAIICIASGNEGDVPCHAGKVFSTTDTELKVLMNGNRASNYVDVWSSTSAPITVSVIVVQKNSGTIVAKLSSSPGKTMTYGAGQGTTGDNLTFTKNYNGTIYLRAQLNANNNRYNVYISPQNVTKKSANLNYQLGIMVEGPAGARIDMYGNSTDYFTNSSFDGFTDPDMNGSVSGLACGPNTISVGAYNNKKSWKNLSGETYTYGNAASNNEGRISGFSSWGELLDGTSRPHVCAPGTGMASSYSNTYVENNISNPNKDSGIVGIATIDEKNHYWAIEQGTSMATPYVAGAVGLWLQANPDLKARDVMDIISTTSIRDNDVSDSPVWGAGKINVVEGLKKAIEKGNSGIGNVIANDGESIYVRNIDGRTFDIFAAGADKVRATLYTLAGAAAAEASASGDNLTLSADNVSAGVYILRVEAGNNSKSVKMVVR